jgi:hypothetical protein
VGLFDSDDTFPAGFRLRVVEPHLSGVGVVYGRESRTDDAGKRTSDWSPEASAESIVESATGIHHFAAINTDCVDPAVFADVEISGAMLCVDWVVRSYAALLHGARFLDVQSYCWRQHVGQVTHNARGEIASAYAAAGRLIQGYYQRRCAQWLKQIPRR